MKRLLLAFLAMIVLQPALAWADDAPDAEAKYQAMVAAAKADPDATDWQALRFAYADRPSFSLYAADDGRTAIHKARTAHDWPGLLAAANTLIDTIYVDGEAHLAASIALSQLGKPEESDREQKIGVAIFQSMMRNGDGHSPEQAFVVISVAEEYELMRARQRRVTSQKLVQTNGHMYDVIVAADPDGGELTFYFEIDRVIAAEARALGAK